MQPTNGSYRRASPSTVTGSGTSGRRRGKALGLVLLAMALLIGSGIAILQTVRTGRATVAEEERLTSMFARMMADIRKSHKTQMEQQGKTLFQGVLHELGDYRPSCSVAGTTPFPAVRGSMREGDITVTLVDCHPCHVPDPRFDHTSYVAVRLHSAIGAFPGPHIGLPCAERRRQLLYGHTV